MARVAIIIPAYNAAAFLADTLHSALNSSYRDIELIVIDDGSVDATADVARSLSDPRCRVISQQNAGMSASRNRGMRESDSEFIALLDSDDLWHPVKLELQMNALTNDHYGVCFTEFLSWDGSSPESFMRSVHAGILKPELTGWIYHKMILTNYALPSSVVFRRTLLNELGVFLCEDHQTDDWEYFVRASTQTQFAKIAAPLVLYRQHPTSLSRKLPRINASEIMREKLLAKYGMTSPQGIPVDNDELDRRRYLGRRHFADAHVSHGQIGLGLKYFLELIISGPRRSETLATLVRSTGKRILRST